MEFIHFLFENYSQRGISKDTDRCVAASGLEARIARALECDSRHGIFQKHLHRNLLWQASDREMERIAYNNNQHVPSWSWMAYSGGVQFIVVKVGSVSWVDELAFDDERDSAALIADVGNFQECTLKSDGDRYTISNLFGEKRGWVQYDVKSDRKFHEEQCVVVGRTESTSEDYYYILVVVPTEKDGEYKRVGVGMVRTGCVEKLRPGVRIV